jgi:hypothetical protein
VKAGAARARPVLRELYETRAGAYRDGVREFVVGYREAFRETLLQARRAWDARSAPAARTLTASLRRRRHECSRRLRAGRREALPATRREAPAVRSRTSSRAAHIRATRRAPVALSQASSRRRRTAARKTARLGQSNSAHGIA